MTKLPPAERSACDTAQNAADSLSSVVENERAQQGEQHGRLICGCSARWCAARRATVPVRWIA